MYVICISKVKNKVIVDKILWLTSKPVINLWASAPHLVFCMECDLYIFLIKIYPNIILFQRFQTNLFIPPFVYDV